MASQKSKVQLAPITKYIYGIYDGLAILITDDM